MKELIHTAPLFGTIEGEQALTDDMNSPRVERAVVATLTGWFFLVLGLGWLHVFGRLHPAAVGVIAVAELLGVVALYYLSAPFQAYVRSVSCKHLTIFTVWRFPAGALFLYYGHLGLLPPLFVRNAAWGDILAACLVPIVLIAGAKK